MTKGALERKETRCWHVRSDYPTRNDPNWDGHVVIRKGAQGMEARFERIDREDS